jgi:hypothetical protein
LDGDQSDEVIVGYNGATGVHVIDGKGQLRWMSTAIGNVWHVTAGDVLGQGTPQIVTTGGAAGVHIFSGDGKRRDIMAPRIFAHMVRVQKVSAKDTAATIFVAGRWRKFIEGAGRRKDWYALTDSHTATCENVHFGSNRMLKQ